MASVGTVLTALQASIAALTQAVANNPQRSARPPNTRPIGCNFCDSPEHLIRNCPEVDVYIRAGKCIRNGEGRVCLPNGRFVPASFTGKNLAERIDKFIAANPQLTTTASVNNTVSAAIFESVESFAYESGTARIEEVTEEEEDDEDEMALLARMYANEVAKRADKKKAAPAKAASTSSHPPVPHVLVPPAPPKVTPQSASKPAGSEPQYRYQAPCEDPATTDRVFNRALDSTIQLSQRELLAVSPDIRKKVKELVTGKRVAALAAANETVEAYSLEPAACLPQHNGLTVAVESAPLRAVDGVLDDRVNVELVLDQGSSIVAIHKKIWEMLGTPVLADHVMDMESAHSSVESTLGLLKNFPLTIGPCTFYLQIQVAHNLSCDLLLGRPFFMLTGSYTQDNYGGSQHLVLNDVNTGQKIRVPTRARTRRQKPASFVGF